MPEHANQVETTETFSDLVVSIAKLPPYMQRDAMGALIVQWRNTHPLVEQVANGSTSFLNEIGWLLQENLQLNARKPNTTCKSPEFEKKAQAVAETFRSILHLSHIRTNGRSVWGIDLSTSFDYQKIMLSQVGYIFGASMVLGIVFLLDNPFTLEEGQRYLYVLGAGCIGILIGLLHYFSSSPYVRARKEFAQTIHRRVRLMDRMCDTYFKRNGHRSYE